MLLETLEVRRTPEGAIDTRHYGRKANAERRAAKSETVRTAARSSKRVLVAIFAFITFWNIPAMGGSKEMQYR